VHEETNILGEGIAVAEDGKLIESLYIKKQGELYYTAKQLH